ncbi:MAG: DUF4129 domain-containing transglutaminase family protein, partial [Bradymonadaceae bacterium]
RLPNMESMHWRTMTFDSYDGTRWSRTVPMDEKPAVARHNVYDTTFLHSEELLELVEEAPELEMQVYLEPIGTNLLPVVWPAMKMELGLGELRLPVNPRSGSLTYDDYGDLRHTMESQIGITYNLVTAMSPGAQNYRDTEAIDLPEDFTTTYLQLPTIAERTRKLATDITADAETPYQKAEAVIAYFEENFTYTTDLPEVDPDDPIASFLFDTRRGHCEYFATSAALLLRSAGVPTRLVNGFLGGTWNEVGSYLTIRQGDAHSWVEVYVHPYGWIPIEPTPPSESPFGQRSPLVRWASDTYDAMRMAWLKWIIEYDLEAQVRVFRRIGRLLSMNSVDAGPSAAERPDRDSDPSNRSRDVIVWMSLIIQTALAFFHGRRRRLTNDPKRTILATVGWSLIAVGWSAWFFDAVIPYVIAPLTLLLGAFFIGYLLAGGSTAAHTTELHRYFLRLERIGRRHGIVRHQDEGPGTYIDRLIAELPTSERDLRFFKDRYLAMRFGGEVPSAEELQKLRKVLKRLPTRSAA